MKKIITCLFSLSTLYSVAQQDPQYGLYQFNQMTINPAYAGARDAIAAILDYRNQWIGSDGKFPGAPTTYAFSLHTPTLNNKVGLGLNVLRDEIGAKNVTGAYGNFAYIAKLNNRFKLSFGLRVGCLNYKFNYSKVTYKDANEPSIADLSNVNKRALDMDAGLFLKSNTFFLGFSATHLVPIKFNSVYSLNNHFFFIVGKAFSLNENLIFNPTLMIKNVRSQTTADLNLNFLIMKRIWLGLFARTDYGRGVLVQVYATDKLRIGYTFDRGSRTRRVLGPSHEIMIGFDFGNYKAKTLSPRFL